MKIYDLEFSCAEDVAREFRSYDYDWDAVDLKILEILNAARHVYAGYEAGGYDGSAYVLYQLKNRQWFLVDGGHCSCFGLEGQWEPENVLPEQIMMMKSEYRHDMVESMKWLLLNTEAISVNDYKEAS